MSAGCGDSGSGPNDPPDGLPANGVRVMTRNLYVGADLDAAALEASPLTLPFVVAEAFDEMIESRFPERAAIIAQEIGIVAPHVIALQEVSLIRIQSPGDLASGGTQSATDVVLDFLPILLAALDGEGLTYSVASIVENADVEVPMISTDLQSLDDVRLTDFDAILVREDVQVVESATGRFQEVLGIPVGVDTVFIHRGYASVIAVVDGQRYRFVSTHLEPADVAAQQSQAEELVAQWATDSLPVVLMGDFNSAAPMGASYVKLIQAGYLDSWTLQDSPAPGLTCCQASDLRNATSSLSQRIDLILVRNPTFPNDPLDRPPLADVFGDESGDRTPSGLWPSDHAGVWAHLIVRN
jgi:hypothetical protein